MIRHHSAGLLNLATGHSISYADLAHAMAKLFDEPISVTGAPRQNPVTHRNFDIIALRQAFPHFSFTPLAAGLAAAHAKDATD